MDQKLALDYFSRQKIIILEQLIGRLECSAITARRRLKQWQTYTSINQNGRYYTLPQIPVFDQNGLWRYQAVLFSKHGNLKQTIISLITDSPKGLSAGEIVKRGFVPRDLRIFVVDGLHLQQREIALILLGLTDLTRHDVAGTQIEPPNLGRRHVNIIQPRQITAVRGP